MDVLATSHGDLPLPAFLPDATRGAVRSVDVADLEECGVKGLMVNILHLATDPGIGLLSKLNGIHSFMGWQGPVAADSGGFQAFSMISGGPKAGRVSKDGFTYRWRGKKRNLTPEKCIRSQFAIGADILFCLDHCTHPGQSEKRQAESVENTIIWSKKCREAFDRELDRNPPDGNPPLLFGVIQGGDQRDLRDRCAEALFEIGFDGYGYGGWPIDKDGSLNDSVEYVADLVPDGRPLHGLGLGSPDNLAHAFRVGYDSFDCTLPTRDARRKRLYFAREDLSSADLGSKEFYAYRYIEDERWAREEKPIDEHCSCICCRRFSLAYLHHLFQVDEGSAIRLSTAHNLTFYRRLLDQLQAKGRP